MTSAREGHRGPSTHALVRAGQTGSMPAGPAARARRVCRSFKPTAQVSRRPIHQRHGLEGRGKAAIDCLNHVDPARARVLSRWFHQSLSALGADGPRQSTTKAAIIMGRLRGRDSYTCQPKWNILAARAQSPLPTEAEHRLLPKPNNESSCRTPRAAPPSSLVPANDQAVA